MEVLAERGGKSRVRLPIEVRRNYGETSATVFPPLMADSCPRARRSFKRDERNTERDRKEKWFVTIDYEQAEQMRLIHRVVSIKSPFTDMKLDREQKRYVLVPDTGRDTYACLSEIFHYNF